MPKYTVQSPSGQTLELEGDAPPTEKELDEIFASVAPADTSAPVQENAPISEGTSASSDSVEPPRTLAGLASIPGKIADKMAADAAELKAQGWENLGTMDRLNLMALSLPKFLGDEILGASRKVEGVAERAVPTSLGQFLGRVTRIPGADRLGGAVGAMAGEALAESREGEGIKPGRLVSAGISGLVTGKSLAGAGAAKVAGEAAKYAGVGAAGQTAETVIDEGRLPTAGEVAVSAGASALGAPAARVLSKATPATGRDAIYDVEMETLRDLRKEGVVIPPHEIGAGSDFVSSIGGKAALQQEAAKRNQFVWQKLAREEIGLSKESLPIRKSELESIRRDSGAPYREIQTIQREAKQHLQSRLAEIAKEADPHAAMIKMEEPAMKESLSILNILASADVDALKKARFDAQRARSAFQAGDPNAYQTWQNAKAQAEALEDAIERAAGSLRDTTLLPRLKDARQKIAKTYAVEDALNPGNGFVDPLSFGRQLVNGEPLSGNLEKIAKFQLAFRREAVEAGRVPAPGVGNLGSMMTTGMASQGDAPGVIGAVVNATAGRAARPILLSDLVQDSMLTPKERQNLSASLARYLAEESAQELSEEQ